MTADIKDVRSIYRALRNVHTHVVQSSEIATSCICQNLFKLSYPYGVVKADKDYLVANTVHDIMSLCIGGPIHERWELGNKDYDYLTRRIIKESSNIIEHVIGYTKEFATIENRPIPDDFEGKVNDIFHGLIIGITKKIMKRFAIPKRIVTELTITNIKNNHEGRIDALLEYDEGYALLDWKTYSFDVSISSHEKWQLISNLLLANYRYTGNEEDWSRYCFSSIVHYTGAYLPRFETVQKGMQTVRSNREFAHKVLCGQQIRAEKPRFCPVCDTGAQGSIECQFYRNESVLAYEGKLPAAYDKIRRQFYGKRYAILKERAETHIHKYATYILIDKLNEEEALSKLEQAGVIHTGYRYNYDEGQRVYLKKSDESVFLEPRRIVRVIGKEKCVPLLASVSEQATVMEVEDSYIVLNFRSKISVERAKKQLFTMPLILLRDEINLTRRMLESIHKFHQLAAGIFIPKEPLE